MWVNNQTLYFLSICCFPCLSFNAILDLLKGHIVSQAVFLFSPASTQRAFDEIFLSDFFSSFLFCWGVKLLHSAAPLQPIHLGIRSPGWKNRTEAVCWVSDGLGTTGNAESVRGNGSMGSLTFAVALFLFLWLSLFPSIWFLSDLQHCVNNRRHMGPTPLIREETYQ